MEGVPYEASLLQVCVVLCNATSNKTIELHAFNSNWKNINNANFTQEKEKGLKFDTKKWNINSLSLDVDFWDYGITTYHGLCTSSDLNWIRRTKFLHKLG